MTSSDANNSSNIPSSSSSSESPILITVINLKESESRKQFFLSGWNEHIGRDQPLLGASPHFHTVDRDPEGGLLGCTRSHMACYQKAIDQNKEACLVFEDDVRVNENLTEEVLRESLALIRSGWDVVRFHKSGLCKVHGALSSRFFHTSSFCGRAYLISRSLMEETLKHDSKEVVPYTST